jgi:2-polyprenyl-3-methyl-5-hydroxy-6-metoxy-1,4-benzoquinol methylase
LIIAVAKERLDPWVDDTSESQRILHLQRYEYAMKEVMGYVLDVGCGMGYGSKMLSSVNSSVVALDISRSALSYAKRKYKGPIYVMSDAQNLPFRNECFDGIVALETVEHVDDGTSLLLEVFRILKDKGTLIISAPNAAHLRSLLRRTCHGRDFAGKETKNPFHKHEYTYREFTGLLKSIGFRIEKKWGQILTLPLVSKLPSRPYINSGRFLPALSFHVVYRARSSRSSQVLSCRRERFG